MPVNPLLSRLQAYPFEKLRSLFQGVVPNPEYSPIRLEMGEPQHPVPHFVAQILQDHIGQLGHYPATLGIAKLRETIAAWLCWRYQLPNINKIIIFIKNP